MPGSVETEVRLLAAKVEAFLDDEADALAVILETQEQILRRVNDNRAILMAILRRVEAEGLDPAGPLDGGHAGRWEDAVSRRPALPGEALSPPATGSPLGLRGLPDSRVGDYDLLVARIRTLVRAVIPAEATVLVVSRGDDELLHLDGRRAWHFPSSLTGQYAGHHPHDGEEAVAHLRELRRKGAEYLLLPRTAFWWLEYYPRFRAHLEAEYEVVLRDDTACVVLSAGSPGGDQPPAVESR